MKQFRFGLTTLGTALATLGLASTMMLAVVAMPAVPSTAPRLVNAAYQRACAVYPPGTVHRITASPQLKTVKFNTIVTVSGYAHRSSTPCPGQKVRLYAAHPGQGWFYLGTATGDGSGVVVGKIRVRGNLRYVWQWYYTQTQSVISPVGRLYVKR